MTKNIGRFDQILRIGLSLGLIYAGFIDEEFINDSFSSNIIGVIGVLSLIVALSRFCPLYVITGINTCHQKDK